MAKVLIIDDDPMMNEALTTVVGRMGHSVDTAFTLRQGVDLAEAGAFDVVFLDVRMPDGCGLDYIGQIRQAPSEPEVIIITAYSDVNGAKLAIENGAWNYIHKPSSLEGMTLPLMRALQYREEKAKHTPVNLKREKIIGSGAKITSSLDDLARAANCRANVLIEGETGTGKEIFARTIHENSDRAGKNFVVVDCASLPESLVEGILFGHERGAFTGADRAREGLIAQAHGGTLFLDEVGELPPALQKSFLRVLQERRFRPLGSSNEQASDFRLVAATNRDLDEMVRQERFRSDLLYRLRSLRISLPPLRDRKEDIRDLVQFSMNRLSTLNATQIKGFSPDFFEALSRYDWPGNVRELLNVMEHVFATASQEATLFACHLPTSIRIQVAQSFVNSELDSKAEPRSLDEEAITDSSTITSYREFRKNTERGYLKRLVLLTGGDKKQACRLSGLSRAHLYQLLKENDIA